MTGQHARVKTGVYVQVPDDEQRRVDKSIWREGVRGVATVIRLKWSMR